MSALKRIKTQPFSAFYQAQDQLEQFSPKAGGCTAYGAIVKGQPQNALSNPCIARLSNHQFGAQPLDAFYIFNLVKSTKDKAANDYIASIINPETSPWQDLVRAQPEQDLDFVMKHGYVLTNLNFPGNYVGNFLTAFRFASEYQQGRLILWDRLIKDGCSIGIVAAICEFAYGYQPATGQVTLMSASGHYAFHTSYSGFEVARRVNERDPDTSQYLKTMFRDSQKYIPCNAVWGKTVGNDAFKQFQTFLKNFKEPPKPKGIRMFSEPVARSYSGYDTASYEAVLQFCKAFDRKEIKY